MTGVYVPGFAWRGKAISQVYILAEDALHCTALHYTAPCSLGTPSPALPAYLEKLWGRCMHVFLHSLGNERAVLHRVKITGPNFGTRRAAARLYLAFAGNFAAQSFNMRWQRMCLI